MSLNEPFSNAKQYRIADKMLHGLDIGLPPLDLSTFFIYLSTPDFSNNFA